MDWAETRDALMLAERGHPRHVEGVSQTGLYAWWDTAGALLLKYPDGFPSVDSNRPLYVGVAAKQSIAARGLGMHLEATRMSTLRRSLAALLYEDLDLLPGVEVQRRGKFKLAPAHEDRLTAWMLRHLTFSWVIHLEPRRVEREIVADLLPPFNDHFAHGGEYWRWMSTIRSDLREKAGARVATRATR